MIFRIAVSCLVCVSLSTEAGAQPPASAKSDWTLLAKGWTAIAAGKPDEAVAVANQILKRRPGSHGALMLKIEGLAAGPRPLAALDAYEEWLTSAGEQVEDRGLLEPVALGLLWGLRNDQDLRVQSTALAALARSGDAEARAQLAQQGGAGNPAAIVALATTGDAAGVTALRRMVETPDRRDKTAAIELLAERGAVTPQLVTALLKDPVPLNRAAVAKLIAVTNQPDATQHLQTLLKDPDPYVRISATLGLARVGEPVAVNKVHAMLTGEVPDLQLLAADALGPGAAQQALQAVRPLLQNPDGLIRFHAAAFVGRTDPAAVRDVLLAGLIDENPVVQEEAARVLADAPTVDLAALRKLLRHGSRYVVAQAAAALLRR